MAASPEFGVSTPFAEALAHDSAFAKSAFCPLLNFSFSSERGIGGVFAKLAVSWPVLVFAATVPEKCTERSFAAFSASTKIA